MQLARLLEKSPMSCLHPVTPSSGPSCLHHEPTRAGNLTEGRQGWVSRIRRVAAGIITVMLMVATGSAQVQFGTQAIGTSSTQPVSVTVSGGATVNAVRVLTLGTQGLDFQAGGTFNCAAQTCTQPVTFAPLYPGLRVGAVVA